MGVGGISIGSLLIVLVIVMLLFGTKRLRNIGSQSCRLNNLTQGHRYMHTHNPAPVHRAPLKLR